MGYRDAQWYIKDTWIDFSATNSDKQAVVHHTFMDDGVPEMVKLLSVAHEHFIKQSV